MLYYEEAFYMNYMPTASKEYITQFGIVHPDLRYQFKERRNLRHLFEYVVRGKGNITIGDESYCVEQGDLVYVAKDTVLSYGSDWQDPYEKLWLGASGEAVDGLISSYLGNQTILIRKNAAVAPFQRLMDALETTGIVKNR